jgi:hypothetical protein
MGGRSSESGHYIHVAIYRTAKSHRARGVVMVTDHCPFAVEIAQINRAIYALPLPLLNPREVLQFGLE